MSHKTIREDKTCLNCYHVVEKLYCPNCGQENIETRKTFHQLFIHFFEDLTHYENSFWKTIRNLVLKPAALTREYLSGKRMSYLAPIRLYIFISFVTFFLIAVLPSGELIKFKSGDGSSEKLSAAEDDFNFEYKNVRELDSMQGALPPDQKLGEYEYKITRKLQSLSDKYTLNEFVKMYSESFLANLPKILFIYLPLFALVLFLFENKKRWYYFDHGIFTLHYFSFLLLMLLIVQIKNALLLPFNEITAIRFFSNLISFAVYGYSFYYFFPAHHRFYGSSRMVTIIKGSLMFVINMLIILFIFIAASLYIILKFH
ncbi:MAG TPA: DUF3667 domain-containing protein [Flavobacterium sp.]